MCDSTSRRGLIPWSEINEERGVLIPSNPPNRCECQGPRKMGPSYCFSVGCGCLTVPPDELERNCIAHLDALGFRYYIPALMLSVLDHYEPLSMRVIGTLAGLYPKKD